MSGSRDRTGAVPPCACDDLGAPVRLISSSPPKGGGRRRARLVAWARHEQHRRPNKHVPDKPTLDGIEARWGEQWEADGTYRFDRDQRAATRCSRSTRRRRPCQRLAARRPRLQLHAHRHDRPLPADARQAGLLPDRVGTTTASPPSAGSRTTTASAATRRCRTTPTSSRRPRRPPKDHAPSRSAGRNFVELCERLVADDEDGLRGAVRAASACRSTGRLPVHDDRRASRRDQPARLPAQPGPRRGLPARRRRRCGTSTSAPRSPRPRWRTATCPAPTTRSPSTAPTAAATSSIDTTRPELLAALRRARRPPRRRPLPAAVRHARSRTPLFGVEVPVVAHPLAEPDKGTGIAMICTFGDVTDVTWWRELDLPTRAVVGRDGRLSHRRAGVDHRPTGQAATRRSPARPPSRRSAIVVELLRRDRASCSASRGRSPTR